MKTTSRLEFFAQGRTRRIYRPAPHGPYYVRFQFRGRDIPRCLGTTDETAAKVKAKLIIDAVYLSGDPSATPESRAKAEQDSKRLKLRSDCALLSAVGEIYKTRFGTDRRRKRTAAGNVAALEKIVRTAGHNFAEARASVLDGALIRAFEAAEEARIERDAAGNMIPASELRIRTSIGSFVKQARSMFKPGTMFWYDGLDLPDLKSFRSQGVTTPERPRPRPLAVDVIAQVNAAAPTLKIDRPAVYIAHLLFSRMGMRNSEIKAARRGWIVRTPKGAKLGVIYRPEEGYKPKKKTERWIPIGPTTLAELDALYRESPDGDFLVPAEHKTHREIIVDREHCAWCAQWIQGYIKVSYELRRYAGSLVYAKTGKIEHVQQFLGHADLKTTLEWYWYLIEDVPSLDAEDFAVAEPVPFSVVRNGVTAAKSAA